MATTNLGRVGLVLRGEWSSTTAYVPLDVVSYDGNSWAAKQSNTNITPNTSNSAFWQLLANNADLVATVQGYKNDAEAAAESAAESAARIENSDVRYDVVQSLTTAQKARARSNISAQYEGYSLLQADDIPNTSQSITFDSSGNVSTITHIGEGGVVRTDTFTFGTNTITEVRMLSTGESLTLVTNLSTLQTTVTYTAS